MRIFNLTVAEGVESVASLPVASSGPLSASINTQQGTFVVDASKRGERLVSIVLPANKMLTSLEPITYRVLDDAVEIIGGVIDVVPFKRPAPAAGVSYIRGTVGPTPPENPQVDDIWIVVVE